MEIKLPICNVVDFYWQTNTINNAYLMNVMETLIWIGYMYDYQFIIIYILYV